MWRQTPRHRPVLSETFLEFVFLNNCTEEIGGNNYVLQFVKIVPISSHFDFRIAEWKKVALEIAIFSFIYARFLRVAPEKNVQKSR